MRFRLAWLGLLVACSGGSVGDGTERADLGGRVDATTDPVDAEAPPPDSGSTPDMGAGLVAEPEPPPPTFPDVIGTLTVSLRTGTGDSAGTDDGVEVCLTETDCFHPNTPEVDDRQVGVVDELHFEGIDLPRSAVDRVVLRSRSDPATDNDRWTPDCLHLRFDGEPVYCNDTIGVHIGTGSSTDEVASWTDPEGLHQECRSCWDDRTLTHGPMLGAPSADGAKVWVRADATRTVGLRVGEREDLSDGVLVDWVQPGPDTDYTAVLEVEGLEPGGGYFYRVEVAGDTTQPVRAIRPSIPPDAERFRMGFGSCSQVRPSPIFGQASGDDLDLYFFIGDNHYANAQHVDAHRWRYRRLRTIPERANLQATTPTVAIWDDHDFLANNSHGACARREHALRGFTEYWANPSYGLAGTPGVFFRHREGPVELFALDCRMYRPDVGDAGSRCELATDPPSLPMSGGPVGQMQLDWLISGVAESDAPFKLVACGSRFTAEGSTDSWAAFDEARDALHQRMHDAGVEGVVFLSGDIHRTLFRTNPRAEGYAIPELSSSPSALGPRDPTCPGEPGQRYCLRENNYVILDVTTDTLTAIVIDEAGDERHRWVIDRADLTG